jgi:hypothetical protein
VNTPGRALVFPTSKTRAKKANVLVNVTDVFITLMVRFVYGEEEARDVSLEFSL